MSVFFPENTNKFGRSSVWIKNDDTDINDYFGSGYPKKLLIELSTKCNLHCQHCGKRHIIQPCDNRIMPKEMIDNIVKDFFDKIIALRIGGASYGEPMVSPYFEYFLRKLKGRAIDVELTTNATLITIDTARLIAATVSIIFISVEGIGKNYELNRGEKWEKIEGIINSLVQERNKVKKDKPLIISFLITVKRELKKDCFKLVRFAKEHKIDLLWVRDFFPGLGEYASSLLYYEKEHKKFYDELVEYSGNLGVPIHCPSPIPQEKSKRNIFDRLECPHPFESFGVLPDGKIITCCVGPLDLGYYFPGEKMVKQRWASEDFSRLRKTVNSGNPLDICRRCESCNYNPLAYIRPLYLRQKIYCYLKKYLPFLAKHLVFIYSRVRFIFRLYLGTDSSL